MKIIPLITVSTHQPLRFSTKYVEFVKFAAMKFQQLNKKKNENEQDKDNKEIEDAKKIMKELTENYGN